VGIAACGANGEVTVPRWEFVGGLDLKSWLGSYRATQEVKISPHQAPPDKRELACGCLVQILTASQPRV